MSGYGRPRLYGRPRGVNPEEDRSGMPHGMRHGMWEDKNIDGQIRAFDGQICVFDGQIYVIDGQIYVFDEK
eukprot:2118405-Heterocapsa_arctica.AAC.1